MIDNDAYVAASEHKHKEWTCQIYGDHFQASTPNLCCHFKKGKVMETLILLTRSLISH